MKRIVLKLIIVTLCVMPTGAHGMLSGARNWAQSGYAALQSWLYQKQNASGGAASGAQVPSQAVGAPGFRPGAQSGDGQSSAEARGRAERVLQGLAAGVTHAPQNVSDGVALGAQGHVANSDNGKLSSLKEALDRITQGGSNESASAHVIVEAIKEGKDLHIILPELHSSQGVLCRVCEYYPEIILSLLSREDPGLLMQLVDSCKLNSIVKSDVFIGALARYIRVDLPKNSILDKLYKKCPEVILPLLNLKDDLIDRKIVANFPIENESPSMPEIITSEIFSEIIARYVKDDIDGSYLYKLIAKGLILKEDQLDHIADLLLRSGDKFGFRELSKNKPLLFYVMLKKFNSDPDKYMSSSFHIIFPYLSWEQQRDPKYIDLVSKNLNTIRIWALSSFVSIYASSGKRGGMELAVNLVMSFFYMRDISTIDIFLELLREEMSLELYDKLVSLIKSKLISDPQKYEKVIHSFIKKDLFSPQEMGVLGKKFTFPKLTTAEFIDRFVAEKESYADIIEENLEAEHRATASSHHLLSNPKKVLDKTFNNPAFRNPEVGAFLKKIYSREKEEFEKGNYTFYHGRSKIYSFVGQVYKKLWEIVHNKHVDNDFVFLRFGWKDKAVLDKRTDYLFMNHALFGNASSPGANTVGRYWVNDQNIYQRPLDELLEEIFNSFDLGRYYQKYRQQLERLNEEYAGLSKYGEILLISIAPDKIDSVRPNGPGGRDVEVTIDGKPEANSKVILDMLRYNPRKVLVDDKPSDRFEWALPITNEYALNPVSGPKFYSFYAMDADKEKTYIQHRDALFEEIRKDIEEGKKKPMARL